MKTQQGEGLAFRDDFGFVRTAVAVPVVSLGDPLTNGARIEAFVKDAAKQDVQHLVFPELCLTGYSCGDLFNQEWLRKSAYKSLYYLIARTREYPIVFIVGMPLMIGDALYNVGVVCARGKVVAVIPKAYPPTYREFYELRWFQPASNLRQRTVNMFGEEVPVGTDILVDVFATQPESDVPLFTLGVEVCEDGWVPVPPSSLHALRGATILANLSASNALVAKADYRRKLFTQQSERCIAGYLYASCGPGESTSAVVFDGDAFIVDNGNVVGSTERFSKDAQLVIADVDVERLRRERRVTSSFTENAANVITNEARRVAVHLDRLDFNRVRLARKVDPHPFVPSDPATRDERCNEIFQIQTAALATRLAHVARQINKREVTIGISGGLDSTLALLVTAKAFDRLGWDRKGIIAVTMPGPGTTKRTRGNAHKLMDALGVTSREIPIEEATARHLRDLGHEPCWQCVQCQNAQARMRTLVLMDLGFMIGTGDLSEIALGWCTYNGDQMAMYGVNAGVPKTLVKFVVGWVAEQGLFGDAASVILRDIVATPISPELTKNAGEEIEQKTEDLIGPYELHDFFLHGIVRYGYAPDKVYFLACVAFRDVYAEDVIRKWLVSFIKRFVAAQFKRDASPNAPKVGSVSLDPRGDWRMPADLSAEEWGRGVG